MATYRDRNARLQTVIKTFIMCRVYFAAIYVQKITRFLWYSRAIICGVKNREERLYYGSALLALTLFFWRAPRAEARPRRLYSHIGVVCEGPLLLLRLPYGGACQPP